MSDTIKGLTATLKKIQELGTDIENKVDATTEANARELEAYAKQLAPVDLGKLRQGIKTLRLGSMDYKVLANATGLAPYSAYMEFGTGGLVVVPPELQEMASKFRGKGVKKVDIRPRPYMYPALVKQRVTYLEDLKQLLETEVKKV